MIERQRIFVTGCVQGVGFRPAVYQLAQALGLTGFIYNDTKGVTIELQGEGDSAEQFLKRLKGSGKPAIAEIRDCEVSDIEVVEGEEGFIIKASDPEGAAVSQVTSDLALCRNCLSEMRRKGDFRYGYPFINCTNCGPRYSIVKNIPYDRSNTTMSAFSMCEKCAGQYANVADRRFHAQPVACAQCGPEIWLTDSRAKRLEDETENVIAETARLLAAGKIVAIKGIGGFHLAVDALNNDAVIRLRERKRRDHKPFALMADSIETIKKYAIVSELAEKVLKSPQSPIVLLPRKTGNTIASAVAEGVNALGFMLCYAPLHYLLFEKLRASGVELLVMTSGNISDEPLICDNGSALEKLGGIADAFLMNDRDIYRQVDDSIVHFIDGEPVLLRRSRGFVPSPVFTESDCGQEILATGGDMKNTFCFVKGKQLICSEHIGDMANAEVYRHFIDSVVHLGRLFEIEPETVVCDLHPGYLSTQYAISLGKKKLLQVQHHWAHIASVLAEYGCEKQVIGIAADGTGYGSDGAIWGCECLIASLSGFERFGHLSYYSLAGGNKASKEAIRPALELLRKAYGEHFELEKFGWLLDRIEPDAGKQRIILQQLEKRVNCVQTSSLGRVFDAVAAMCGLGSYNHFEAQLPMALEAVIEKGIEERYDFEIIRTVDKPVLIDLRKTIKGVVCDVKQKIEAAVISVKFHNCLAAALLEMAKQARQSCGLETVALSGGVFCNRYLTDRLIELLKKNDFCVLFNREVPSNDGGVSLGQAAIAANLLKGKQ